MSHLKFDATLTVFVVINNTFLTNVAVPSDEFPSIQAFPLFKLQLSLYIVCEYEAEVQTEDTPYV